MLTAETQDKLNTTRKIRSTKTRIIRRASTIQNIALMKKFINTKKKTRNTSRIRNIAIKFLKKRLLTSRQQSA